MGYLFIGGTRDGQRIETCGHPEIYFPVQSDRAKYIFSGRLDESKPHEVYRRMVHSASVSFYVLNSIPRDDVMQMLVDGYNPQKDSKTATSE